MSNQLVEQQLNDLAIQKSYIIPMMFSPIAWDSAQNSSRSWNDTEFPPNPRSLIPRRSGVYVFVVAPNMFDFDSSNGLFYVGKATNLYERIGAYLGEIGKEYRRSTRPHIWTMVNRWNGHLRYFFTETQDVTEAEALEDEMLKAFRPYFNRQYDAETSREMRAF